MNEMNEWVRLFLEAETHPERAGVLVAAPVAVLMKYCSAFGHACEKTGFSPGVEYLNAIRTMLGRRRHRGMVPCTEYEAANTTLLGFVEQGVRDDG
ncbi:hypothetical protein CSC94_05975 [Zhengella mangrovi]|uniref:Uncharacterized protein n=1 Tax=Zhengella mangrovi TaxID=1982044 RepID=A0A2G1QSL7_9HYPH|nr:hypothetical protein [Zhengella mangrovi]PHP68198.1 hypothetical protein CSC94_05975 [Zhengella mangrovi]